MTKAPSVRPPTLPVSTREALLVEFEIAEGQLMALADSIPAEQFAWRPDQKARSVSAVFVHVAAGNFFSLDQAGHRVPLDLYGEIAGEGQERLWNIVRRNDELEKSIIEKGAVATMLTRSLAAVRLALAESDDATLEELIPRRIYFRIVAHTHEHMGQMIAYARMIGLQAPWPDWRPDRREKNS